MSNRALVVRPFATAEEYARMVDYFVFADDEFLRGMGVDRNLLPPREVWLEQLLQDHARPDTERERLYLAWLLDGRQIGHSSVNKITVGKQAHFHLHMWRPDLRRSGFGLEVCRKSIALYFSRLNLQRLWCEPFAENAAPNRTLPKLGFEFVRRYRTVPGPTAFEQDVNLYVLSRSVWEQMSRSSSDGAS